MANETSTLGSVFGSAGISAAGNLAGAGIGYFLNELAADNQLSRQKELQEHAFNLNQQAVNAQAQNEVNGLSRAGLNPAMADGAGAPVVSAGQAGANGVPTLGNIFDGIAQVITAAKAPSEVSRTESDINKTSSEIKLNEQKLNFINPQMMDKTSKEIDSLVESVKGAKNLNDAFKAGDDFLRKHSSVVFERMQNALEEKGLWDALSEDTKNTISGLASGSITLGAGEVESLKKLIDTQLNLSDSDSRIVKNAFDNYVLGSQWQDKEVMAALTKLPQDTQKMLYKQMDKITAEIKEIDQLIKVGKADVALKRAQKLRTDFERESAELNDVKWLAKHGRFDDVDVRTSELALEEFNKKLDGVLNTIESVAEGHAIGRGIGAGKSSPSGSSVRSPTEKELMQYGSGNPFGKSLIYAR